MKKMRFIDYKITVEILNGYLVVCCRDFDIFQVAGALNPLVDKIVNPSQIGNTYFKVALMVENILKDNNQKYNSLHKCSTLVKNEKITLTQAASILELSLSSVRRLINDGKIKCEKTIGGHRRPLLSSIYQYKKTFLN
jgi:excisionase family DNA binding protein